MILQIILIGQLRLNSLELKEEQYAELRSGHLAGMGTNSFLGFRPD